MHHVIIGNHHKCINKRNHYIELSAECLLVWKTNYLLIKEVNLKSMTKSNPIRCHMRGQ
jgi:hypothetical protein